MIRTLPLSILAMLLLSPWSPIAFQGGTATPSAALAVSSDPEAIAEAISAADAPKSLPGNVDTEIEIIAWEDFDGEPLDQPLGAWLFTGSPDLPIATLIVFSSPENAEQGIADYKVETSAGEIGGLDMWSVADRGKWLCIAADGPVVILGQAEPQPDESDEDVQQRSCEVVQATHEWLLNELSVTSATPEPDATPGS